MIKHMKVPQKIPSICILLKSSWSDRDEWSCSAAVLRWESRWCIDTQGFSQCMGLRLLRGVFSTTILHYHNWINCSAVTSDIIPVLNLTNVEFFIFLFFTTAAQSAPLKENRISHPQVSADVHLLDSKLQQLLILKYVLMCPFCPALLCFSRPWGLTLNGTIHCIIWDSANLKFFSTWVYNFRLR